MVRTARTLLVVFTLLSAPLWAAAQQPTKTTLDQIEDTILLREHAEVESLERYSPLVETYIQYLRPDRDLGTVPDGDKYSLGHAELGKALRLEPFIDVSAGGIRPFLPMIFVDTNGFDREHYKLDYVRREFLGDVRCLVFDVTPREKSGKGRFLGRIWAEDQDYHIVRFNGAFVGSTRTNQYFHFDSWRINAGDNEWLPAFIYSEQGDLHKAITEKLTVKAQTRLWGYNIGPVGEEQELSKIFVESPTPVNDQTTSAEDISPFQVERVWDRHAEDNVADRMQRLGLLAPQGEVDKALEAVVNNLEVSNNLDIQPEIRCRVLMTSTLESFTVGHTIVLSRGLIDVLPDEATLAAILAIELEHVVLGHRIDAQYAFFDRLLFDDKDTFRHFDFARTPEEEQAAHQKAIELLKDSPYKDRLATAQLFIQALQSRSKQIPNLISPRLGDRVLMDWTVSSSRNPAHPPETGGQDTLIVALPLGARIRLDPWSDELKMIKAQPVAALADSEKMPFEITPFLPYLTRQSDIRSVRSDTTGVLSQARRQP